MSDEPINSEDMPPFENEYDNEFDPVTGKPRPEYLNYLEAHVLPTTMTNHVYHTLLVWGRLEQLVKLMRESRQLQYGLEVEEAAGLVIVFEGEPVHDFDAVAREIWLETQDVAARMASLASKISGEYLQAW